MTKSVAPVEGHLYLLFTEYENTTNIRKWSKEPFYGAQEYVPVGELERLRAAVKLAEDTFKWYGDLHAAKPDMEKAYRNYELAQHMATALQGDTP